MIRFGILIAWAYIRRIRIWFFALLLLLILLTFVQLKFNIFNFSPIVREGLIGTYQEHDLPKEVTKLLSSSLVEMDDEGRVKPALASSWDINNDATIFTFKLKEGLYFADGTTVRAEDLEFGIADTEVKILDEKTIQFKLKESYSPFPSLMTKPVFKKGTLIGTGPYKVKTLEKSRIFITKITLEPNRRDLPKIYVRFYPNEKVAMAGFNLGEVQALLGLPNPNPLLANPQVKLKQKKDFQKIVTILYNVSDSLLSNRSVRQALSFQAPKIEGEEEANNPFPKSLWAYDAEAKKYLANEEEAKDALERAEANMPSEKMNQQLVLTTTPQLEETGQKIVSSWKGLPFDVKSRVESGIPQNFQALLITQTIPADPDQYFLWHSSQTKTNLTKYSQARVDKDLEDGRKAISEEDRRGKYFDFQKALLEDAPATFLYFPKYNIVYLKKVEKLLDQVLSLQKI